MSFQNDSQFDTKAVVAGLGNNQPRAQQAVFDEYHQRLVKTIRSNVAGRLGRRLDASDIALSAFASFFLRAREGGFRIRSRQDLWGLLVAITLNKLRNQVKFHHTQKRGAHQEEYSEAEKFNFTCRNPLPSEEAVLNDALEQVLSQVRPIHKEIAERILLGQPSSEIATTARRSLRTVRRVETLLRQLIEQELVDSECRPQQDLA